MESRTETANAPSQAVANGQEPGPGRLGDDLSRHDGGLDVRPIWKDYGRKGVRYFSVRPGQDMGKIVSAEQAMRIRPDLFEEGGHVAKVDDSGPAPRFYDVWGNQMTANEAINASPELFDRAGRLRVVGLDEIDLDVLEVITSRSPNPVKAATIREALGLGKSDYARIVKRLARRGLIVAERHGYWQLPGADRPNANANANTGRVLDPVASGVVAQPTVVAQPIVDEVKAPPSFGSFEQIRKALEPFMSLAPTEPEPEPEPMGAAELALLQAREHATTMGAHLVELDGKQPPAATVAAYRDLARLWLDIGRAELELDVIQSEGILEGREPTES